MYYFSLQNDFCLNKKLISFKRNITVAVTIAVAEAEAAAASKHIKYITTIFKQTTMHRSNNSNNNDI
jgi:hypothetical protein